MKPTKHGTHTHQMYRAKDESERYKQKVQRKGEREIKCEGIVSIVVSYSIRVLYSIVS